MPSQAMQELIDTFRDRQKASASQASPTLKERRATFAPAGCLHPIPDDVLVSEVIAGGVPAHWLAAPGADAGRALLFLHGGGYELGSLRSDGELAARLGRASGMRVLFPEYRLAPEHPFPAAIDDVQAAWRCCAPTKTSAQHQSRWPETPPAAGSPSPSSWPRVTPGSRCRRPPH